MNKNYRTIWNEALGAWVAASENDSARGKPNKRSVVALMAVALIACPHTVLAQYSAGLGAAAQTGAIAIGGNNGVTNASTAGDIAIGSAATANSGSSVLGTMGPAVAIGWDTTASGLYATALGAFTFASAANATAIGAHATATSQGATAIGYGATANAVNSVALGYGSIADGMATPALGTTINGVQYTFAGISAYGIVSVGSPGDERVITNVGAGQISSTSTDAINGSELYATNQAITAVASSVTSLSTAAAGAVSASSSIASLSTGLSSTNSSVTSLSTSTSTGISTAQSGVTSLSTSLSSTKSTVTSLSTSASTGISTAQSGVTSLSTGLS
ncbi:ESPR-type extended signal peptide-containing protein, partial [Burkholderia sola]